MEHSTQVKLLAYAVDILDLLKADYTIALNGHALKHKYHHKPNTLKLDTLVAPPSEPNWSKAQLRSFKKPNSALYKSWGYHKACKVMPVGHKVELHKPFNVTREHFAKVVTQYAGMNNKSRSKHHWLVKWHGPIMSIQRLY